MRKGFKFSLAILLTAMVTEPAIGNSTGDSCTIYPGGHRDIPIEARNILSRHKHSAVRICLFEPGRSIQLYLRSLPRAVAPRVCEIEERVVQAASALKSVDRERNNQTPAVFGVRGIAHLLARSDGKCPAPDAPAYVYTDDINPEVFLSATRAVSTLTRSFKTFDRGCNAADPDSYLATDRGYAYFKADVVSRQSRMLKLVIVNPEYRKEQSTATPDYVIDEDAKYVASFDNPSEPFSDFKIEFGMTKLNFLLPRSASH